MDSIIGWIVGAITIAGAAAGWVNKKFQKAEEYDGKERAEIHSKVSSLNDRVSEHDKMIATIMANERHTSERLAGFQVIINSVNDKQDKQTVMLSKIIAQNEIILKVKRSTDDE
jgi:hypothetical protein